MYTLQLRKQVVKFINARTPKERKIIAKAFEELRTNPYHNTLDIKKLRETAQKYRLRIGGLSVFICALSRTSAGIRL
jgi:mRNA-degrading endonuclease RelE of RelBE toxin-antitoxin system